MPKPPANPDPFKWTLDLPAGPECSVGWSNNEIVEDDGSISLGRESEDRFYTCNFHGKIQLYMVLDGHDGSKACEFVQKYLPSVLLRSELDGPEEVVLRALRSAFQDTEREFFLKIDPHITRKITLQIEMNAHNSAEALKLFPEQVEEIQRLDSQIKGGTTVVLGLIYNNYLHIANVGDSRALLCHQMEAGGLRVEQLSMDHTTHNELELRRLSQCGLDPLQLRRMKRLGVQQNTRSIGDYSIKGGFKDIDIISHATREPGSAEPHTTRAVNISDITGFLILMSDGLYDAYEAWTKRPTMVNEDIAHLVAKEMRSSIELHRVAQNVVQKVKDLFQTTCKKEQRASRLDDITLIIRNFGFPLARSTSENPFFPPISSADKQKQQQQQQQHSRMQTNQQYQHQQQQQRQNPDGPIYSIQPSHMIQPPHQQPPRAEPVRSQTMYHKPPEPTKIYEYQHPQPREPTGMRRVASGPLDTPPRTAGYTEPGHKPYHTNPPYLMTTPSVPAGLYAPHHLHTPPSRSGNDPTYRYPIPGYDRTMAWDPAASSSITPTTSTTTPSPPYASTPPTSTQSPHTQQTSPSHRTNSSTLPPPSSSHTGGGGTGGVSGSVVKHEYINVTNPAVTMDQSHLTNASPMYTSATLPRTKKDTSSPLYENVELKPERETQKRFSDSLLEEKTQAIHIHSGVVHPDILPPSSLETRPKTLLAKDQGMLPTRPKSAEPAPVAKAQPPSSQQEEEETEANGGEAAEITDEELYGWTVNTPTPSQPNSLASSALVPSQPSTLTASSQSSMEDSQQSSKATEEGSSRSRDGGDEDSDSDGEYHNFSADISDDILDCSEVSDPDTEDNDEAIDDGKIKSYAPFPRDKFPFDFSWDDIRV